MDALAVDLGPKDRAVESSYLAPVGVLKDGPLAALEDFSCCRPSSDSAVGEVDSNRHDDAFITPTSG